MNFQSTALAFSSQLSALELSRAFSRTSSRLVAIAVVAAGFALLAPPAHAQRAGDVHRTYSVTPPASLAAGQMMRVSFYNGGSNPLEIIPCVFDGDGAHLKTGAVIRLAGGQTRFLDMSYSETGAQRRGSVSVRAGIHAESPHLKNLVVSGEVVDETSGRIDAYVPGVNAFGDGSVREANPPDPVRGVTTLSLAPVGIVGGETLRVVYLNAGSSLVTIVPCVYDGEGAHVSEGAPVVLEPGQTRSFDTSWRQMGGERASIRPQVRGAVHVRKGDAKDVLLLGEVVDEVSGKSTTYLSPGAIKGFNPQPDPPKVR